MSDARARLTRLGERLLARVRSLRIPYGDQAVAVQLSIGAAALQRGDDAPRWLERADRALYAAKAAGRDRLAVAPAGESPDQAGAGL